MYKIQVYNEWDGVPKVLAEGENEAVLAFDGEYRKNDIIEFDGLTAGKFYVVQVDAAIAPSLIYTMTDTIKYKIPFYELKESYNPISFTGNRHYISIREASEDEINVRRDLALNPFDQHDVSDVYPHASANIETRGESVFAARNAIDGVKACTSHGEWPYESWGINRRADAMMRLDFGIPVDIDEIRLYTRADFPHDSYWTAGDIEFSDGSSEHITMEKKTGVPHVFNIKRNHIMYLTLENLIKAPDDSPFPALTEIEVYGRVSHEE